MTRGLRAHHNACRRDSNVELGDEHKEEEAEADPGPDCTDGRLVDEVGEEVSLGEPGPSELDMCVADGAPGEDTT